MGKDNRVTRVLTRRIGESGPIRVSEFMEIALSDPEGGYYATRDPFGVAGDFTTAPEISQVFGELLGLWCADSWQAMGAPDRFALVEFGPGRGTLMADTLRAMAVAPACRAAAEIHLVETSPVLRGMQERTLAGVPVTWHTGTPETGDLPLLCLANEFLDALPVEQYVRNGGAWFERRVDHDRDAGTFRFVTGPAADGLGLPEAHDIPDGEIFERAPAVEAVVAAIAGRIARCGGAALFVDYGYTGRAIGETLQAVLAHQPVDTLADPGNCDLTAHVNFRAVRATAEAAGAGCHGTVDQGVFLERLGIRARAQTLLRSATPEQQRDISAAVTRLIGPAEMGTLLKVLAISHPGIDRLAGFEPAS
jgi:NADH dehydrogenase [ubiquinone] 1 alpha subcomplex assembly factor 7